MNQEEGTHLCVLDPEGAAAGVDVGALEGVAGVGGRLHALVPTARLRKRNHGARYNNTDVR